MTSYFCRRGSTQVCQVPQAPAGSKLLEEELDSLKELNTNLADDVS